MSDDLILDQFSRLLDSLPAGEGTDPWPALAASGFLDLLRDAESGGAGLSLAEFFPLVFETGRRAQAPRVVETMVARLVDAGSMDVADLEAALAAGGLAVAQAKALAAAVAAALMAGAVDRLQEMTIDYASTRKQFGREIAKFQAIQHQIAVMAEEVMAARMAAQLAFEGPPLEMSPRRAAMAKLRCGQAAQSVGAIAHAVHGAIGVSREHGLHHYTRALQQRRLAHGGESYWARELGRWALGASDDVTTLVRTL